MIAEPGDKVQHRFNWHISQQPAARHQFGSAAWRAHLCKFTGEVHDNLTVRLQSLSVPLQERRLDEVIAETDAYHHALSGPHLVSCGHDQVVGVSSNLQAEV